MLGSNWLIISISTTHLLMKILTVELLSEEHYYEKSNNIRRTTLLLGSISEMCDRVLKYVTLSVNDNAIDYDNK